MPRYQHAPRLVPSAMPTLAMPIPVSHRVLRDRNEYHRCHVLLMDEENPTAAIEVDGNYYSFFRVVNEPDRANQLIDRLTRKSNSQVMVTEIPKGYALWVHEPDARLHSLRQKTPVRSSENLVTEQALEMLTSDREYIPCQIQVPDLDKPLTGISYHGKLYSLLRIVRDEKQARELSQRLHKKGNRCLISSSAYGYSVWVLEPDGKAT